MEHDHYKFRSKARLVAFVDLILSSMSLCLCLIFFIALLRISTMDEHELIISRRGKVIQPHGSLLDMDTPQNSNKDKEVETISMQVENGGDGRSSDVPGTSSVLGGKTRTIPLLTTSDPGFVKIMWIFLALIAIMTAVQLLAAIRLLNATQIGKDPIGAVKLCRFWRLVCIFFTGLLIFNFLSAFRQRSENFLEVSFLMTSILIRIVALYIVQQFLNELDMTIVTTLPIRRPFHPARLPPAFGLHHHHHHGDMLYTAYGGPSGGFHTGGSGIDSGHNHELAMAAMAPPPKYEDVVKEPYLGNGTEGSSHATATRGVDGGWEGSSGIVTICSDGEPAIPPVGGGNVTTVVVSSDELPAIAIVGASRT